MNNLKIKEVKYMDKRIVLDVRRFGIIFYSLKSVEWLKEGEDYLYKGGYYKPKVMIGHIHEGTLVGFGTAGSGRFILNIIEGNPCYTYVIKPDFSLDLCVKVTDNKLYFNDLNNLSSWKKDHSKISFYDIESGLYGVHVDTWLPSSKIRGDDQQINMFFYKVDTLPKFEYSEVPTLY